MGVAEGTFFGPCAHRAAAAAAAEVVRYTKDEVLATRRLRFIADKDVYMRHTRVLKSIRPPLADAIYRLQSKIKYRQIRRKPTKKQRNKNTEKKNDPAVSDLQATLPLSGVRPDLPNHQRAHRRTTTYSNSSSSST